MRKNKILKNIPKSPPEPFMDWLDAVTYRETRERLANLRPMVSLEQTGEQPEYPDFVTFPDFSVFPGFSLISPFSLYESSNTP